MRWAGWGGGGGGGVTIVLVQFADQWYLGRLLELLWQDGSIAKFLLLVRAQKRVLILLIIVFLDHYRLPVLLISK